MSRHQSPAIRRQAIWSVVDQVISSGTNVLLPILGIRSLGVSEAGRFSVLLSMLFLLLGVSRGLLGESFVVYASKTDESTKIAVRAQMLGLATITGALCLVPIALAHFFVTGSLLGAGLVALAFVGVIVQDAVRFVLFEAGRPERAAANDLLWLVLFVGSAVLIDNPNAGSLVVTWSLSGAMCGLVGIRQLRSLPDLHGAVSLLRSQFSTSWRIAAEFLVTAGVPQVLVAVAGIAASLDGGARYRLALTLLSPSGVVTSGLTAGLQAPASRSTTDRRLRAIVGFASAGAVIAVLLCLTTALVLPEAVGISLLGEAFRGIKPLVAVLAVSSLSLSLCATLSLAIRARGLVATSLKVRVAAGAATLALAVPVASAFGAMGTAWLFSTASVATLVGLIVWCRPFRESVATLPAPV